MGMCSYQTFTSRDRRKKSRGMDSIEELGISMAVDQKGNLVITSVLAKREGHPVGRSNDLVHIRETFAGLSSCRNHKTETALLCFACTRTVLLPLPSFIMLSKNTTSLPPPLPPHTSASRDLQHPFLCMCLSCKKPTLVIHFQTHQCSCSS